MKEELFESIIECRFKRVLARAFQFGLNNFANDNKMD